MNVRLSFLSVCTTLVAALAGCALQPPAQTTHATVFSHPSFAKGGWETRAAVLADASQISALYLDADGNPVFQTREQLHSIPLPAEKGSWQFLGLHKQSGTIFASWWTHQPRKSIYVSTSTDGGKTFDKPSVANGSAAEPLYPFELLVPGHGTPPSVIYLDERGGSYHVYINHYDPTKASWAKTDEQLDVGPLTVNPSGVPALGEFPAVFHSGSTYVVTWLSSIQTAIGKRYRLLARTSLDGGEHWKPATLVLESPHSVSPAAGAVVDGKLALVVEVAQEGLIEAQASPHGDRWTTSKPLPQSELNTNSGIQIAVGHGAYADRLFMVWSARKMLGKAFILSAAIDVNKQQWLGEPIRLDLKTQTQTQSTFPYIASNAAGDVLAAWIDYRNILPNIYVSGSTDGGITWTSPQNVQRNGMQEGMTPVLLGAADHFVLAYQEANPDKPTAHNLIVRKIAKQNNTSFGPFPLSTTYSAAEMRAKLLQRENEFWKYRLAAQPAKLWGYYDPSYRAFVPEKPFVNMEQDFKYFDYKIKSVSIDGNIAETSVETTFEIPGVRVFGHLIKQARRTGPLRETWLWIGDNWYQEFKNPITGPYIQY